MAWPCRRSSANFARGKDLSFDSMGEVTLKGVSEPAALFNVKISG